MFLSTVLSSFLNWFRENYKSVPLYFILTSEIPESILHQHTDPVGICFFITVFKISTAKNELPWDRPGEEISPIFASQIFSSL